MVLFDNVPEDNRIWLAIARLAGLDNKTLRTHNNLKSASEVTQEQFMLYRTLFNKYDIYSFAPNLFGLGQKHQQALGILQGQTQAAQDFQSYITAIRNGNFTGQGDFGLVRDQQREVLECPSGPGNPLTSKDESPVNATFVNMLQALNRLIPNRPSRWRHSKIKLIAKLYRGRKFSAITDGQLQNIGTGRIMALVECKRADRTIKTREVDMQEATQIVAWIINYPDGTYQRVIVSQDDDQIYITFAVFNQQWLDYLIHGRHRNNPASFMTMHQFGPWSLGNADEVENVAAILLAISI